LNKAMMDVPDSMKGPGRGTAGGRVVVLAESGVVAGDLVALLSGRFSVERATSVPGAALALGRVGGSLVVVGEGAPSLTSALRELVERTLAVGDRVLMLGADARLYPPEWSGRVRHLPALPEPALILAALEGGSPPALEAES
jgi:hypothetical protein